ncbi:17718_t:CDS:2, partial [Gigaspora margarita]
MSKVNSTNLSDSKDQDLKLENTSFEASLELEKVPQEKCEQSFPKIEVANGNLNIDDPRNWPSKKKWLVLAIITIAGMSHPIATIIQFPALVVMRNEFNASNLAINTFGSSSTFFLGIGAIFFAAYSDELATRKKVYITSFIIFILTSVVCAIATNIWLLIILRSIQACCNSAMLPLSAGVISDIYNPHATMFGGFIAQYLGWRWIFWILAIFGGALLSLILFFLPETFNANNSLKSNQSLRFNPIAPLKLFKYPNIALVIIYICISTSLIHIQHISIPTNFSARYNFTTSQIGLFFIAPDFGYMFGSLLGGKYSDFLSQKLLISGDYYPEVRLKGAWFGSLLIPITCFIYGWLLEINFNVYILGIVLFLCSFGMLSTFSTLSTYLVDSCPGLGASVMALASLIRFAIPGIISIFETSIEERLSIRWMFTLISALCFL